MITSVTASPHPAQRPALPRTTNRQEPENEPSPTDTADINLPPQLKPSDYDLPLRKQVRAALTPALGTALLGGLTWGIATIAGPVGVAFSAVLMLAYTNNAFEHMPELCDRIPRLGAAASTAAAVGGGFATVALGPAVPAVLLCAGWLNERVREELEWAQCDHIGKTNQVAYSGSHRTSELFHHALSNAELSVADRAAATRELESLQALEQQGYRLGDTLSGFSDHLVSMDYRQSRLYGPDSEEGRPIFLRDLPVMAALCGHGSIPDGFDAEIAARLVDCIDRGTSLLREDRTWNGEGVPSTRAGRLIDLVDVLHFAGRSPTVMAHSGTLFIPLSSDTVSDLVIEAEAATSFIEGCHRHSSALTEALRATDSRDASKLFQAIRVLTPDAQETHLAALDALALAGAVSGQQPVDNETRPEYSLRQHYETLLASRDPNVALEQSTAQYVTLLSALVTIGKANEAPELYRAIRASLAAGASNETFEDKTQRAFTVLGSGGTIEAAASAVLRAPQSEQHEGIEKEDGVVRIGGVEIPVHR